MSNYLSELARSRSGSGKRGIYSVCSAHPWVLEAAMERQRTEPGPLLIEATCNQVNQAGGYTGMTPDRFRQMVYLLAARCGFPQERILLGGDHLGPFPWRQLPWELAPSQDASGTGFHAIQSAMVWGKFIPIDRPSNEGLPVCTGYLRKNRSAAVNF